MQYIYTIDKTMAEVLIARGFKRLCERKDINGTTISIFEDNKEIFSLDNNALSEHTFVSKDFVYYFEQQRKGGEKE